jgi:hypothetical protein
VKGGYRSSLHVRAAGHSGAARQSSNASRSGWTSLIVAPPYPEHPSGLSAVGCSIADTLQHFYDRDRASSAARRSPD